NLRITNFEMETSAIYGLGRLMGHHCLSINTMVANRVTRRFSPDNKRAIEVMIEKSLEVLMKDS
ncbi:MAG TPA: phosphorylase, partial [Chitinophagaceae bacterium]|nr:phosphorylase [Chitinophagaceae bacterium]